MTNLEDTQMDGEKTLNKPRDCPVRDANDDDLMRPFNPYTVIATASHFDAHDSAQFWQKTIWVFLFLVISLFQAYIGIKIVFFKVNSSLIFYISIYTINILLSHIELYFTKQYIDDCIQPEEIKHISLCIHEHQLIKKSITDGWYRCDVCCDDMYKISYQCSKCNFDCCDVCWKGRDKRRRADNITEPPRKVSVYEYFKKLLKCHLKYKKSFIIGLILLFLHSLISLSQSSNKGIIFDNVINKDISGFYSSIEKYVIFTIIGGILGSIETFLLSRINKSIINDFKQELFHKTMCQDMVFYDASSASSLIDRCTWGLEDMIEPWKDGVKSMIESGTNIIGGIIMCWLISYRLTLLGLSTLGPVAYLGKLFQKWWRDNIQRTWSLSWNIKEFTSECFDNIHTIRSFSKEPLLIEYYKQLCNNLHNFEIKASVFESVNDTLTNWIQLAGSTLIMWAGGIIVFLSLNGDRADGSDAIDANSGDHDYEIAYTWSLLNDMLTLGQLVAFETYWGRLESDINTLRRLFGRFTEATMQAKYIFRTLRETPKIELLDLDKADIKQHSKCDDIYGDICFNNVHFTYQLEPNKPVLKGINLKIPKGKTTAFVGRSGSGKTTMLSLLLRYYDPVSGSITVNDSKNGKIIDDIKNYNVYYWRNNIAMVSQETELFANLSLAHNIGFGKTNYSKRDLISSCKLANAHDFILKFECGYDTTIGERGNKLSGGQKQRISIARMLMKKPSLILLDEATSSLDAESEAIVQAALEHAIEDSQCTVILVAHRLSTVINADQIAVIDDGRVAECGTHDELLDKKGVYYRLVERQVNLKQRMKDKVKQMHMKHNHVHSHKKNDNKHNENSNDGDTSCSGSSDSSSSSCDDSDEKQESETRLKVVDDIDALMDQLNAKGIFGASNAQPCDYA